MADLQVHPYVRIHDDDRYLAEVESVGTSVYGNPDLAQLRIQEILTNRYNSGWKLVASSASEICTYLFFEKRECISNTFT